MYINLFAFSFYDDSIFIFEKEEDLVTSACWDFPPKMYSIILNKWTNLPDVPFGFPSSCIGFNQKIISVGREPGIWAYDLLISSYSHHFLHDVENDDAEDQILIKTSEKLYLLYSTYNYKIYCCDDPLSAWTILCNLDDLFQYDFIMDSSLRAYYGGSIYFFRNADIFQFDLKTHKSKKIRKISLDNNKTIQKI